MPGGLFPGLCCPPCEPPCDWSICAVAAACNFGGVFGVPWEGDITFDWTDPDAVTSQEVLSSTGGSVTSCKTNPQVGTWTVVISAPDHDTVTLTFEVEECNSQTKSAILPNRKALARWLFCQPCVSANGIPGRAGDARLGGATGAVCSHDSAEDPGAATLSSGSMLVDVSGVPIGTSTTWDLELDAVDSGYNNPSIPVTVGGGPCRTISFADFRAAVIPCSTVENQFLKGDYVPGCYVCRSMPRTLFYSDIFGTAACVSNWPGPPAQVPGAAIAFPSQCSASWVGSYSFDCDYACVICAPYTYRAFQTEAIDVYIQITCVEFFDNVLGYYRYRLAVVKYFRFSLGNYFAGCAGSITSVNSMDRWTNPRCVNTYCWVDSVTDALDLANLPNVNQSGAFVPSNPGPGFNQFRGAAFLCTSNSGAVGYPGACIYSPYTITGS